MLLLTFELLLLLYHHMHAGLRRVVPISNALMLHGSVVLQQVFNKAQKPLSRDPGE